MVTTSRKFMLALVCGASPIVAVAVGLIVFWRVQAHLPDEVESMLEQAETFELLSIDPTITNSQLEAPGVEVFHHYRVIGKTTISDRNVQQKIIAALNRSVAK